MQYVSRVWSVRHQLPVASFRWFLPSFSLTPISPPVSCIACSAISISVFLFVCFFSVPSPLTWPFCVCCICAQFSYQSILRVATDVTYLVRVLLPALIHSLLMFLYCSILFSITVSVFFIITFLVSFRCSPFAHSSHVWPGLPNVRVLYICACWQSANCFWDMTWLRLSLIGIKHSSMILDIFWLVTSELSLLHVFVLHTNLKQ